VTRLLAEMTSPEVGLAVESGALALIPVGSMEAHGPHLPVGTDCLLAEDISKELALRLELDGVNTVIVPTIPYSVAECARGFPGTISLRGETVEAILVDVAGNLAEHGFRQAAILCFHLEPKNAEHVQSAARTIRETLGLEIDELFVSTSAVWLPRLRSIIETRLRQDLHGGEMETSIMLRLRPELVRENWKQLPPTDVDIIEIAAAGIPFRDVGPGYFGAPARSSADKGERIMALLVSALAQAVQELLGKRKT